MIGNIAMQLLSIYYIYTFIRDGAKEMSYKVILFIVALLTAATMYASIEYFVTFKL